jgi:hypothetical protein
MLSGLCSPLCHSPELGLQSPRNIIRPLLRPCARWSGFRPCASTPAARAGRSPLRINKTILHDRNERGLLLAEVAGIRQKLLCAGREGVKRQRRAHHPERSA